MPPFKMSANFHQAGGNWQPPKLVVLSRLRGFERFKRFQAVLVLI